MAGREAGVTSNNINFNKVCRTCLLECEHLHSMFLTDEILDGSNYGEMLSECTKLQISKDDGLPPTICNNCVQDIKSAFIFKHRAEKSDTFLRSYLCQKTQMQTNIYTNIKVEKDIQDDVEIKAEQVADQDCKELDTEDRFHNEDVHFTENGDYSDDDVKPLNALKNSILKNTCQQPEEIQGFKCTVCNVSFTKQSQLKRHKCFPKLSETHNEIFDKSDLNNEVSVSFGAYECMTCNEAFQYADQLEEHVRVHLSTRPPKKRGRPSKKDCEAKLQLQSYLDKMTFKEYEVDQDDPDKDTDQDYIPDSSKLMKYDPEQKYYCGVCDKLFITKNYFQTHMRKHDGRKFSQCKICERTYVRLYLLKKHVLTHCTVEGLSAINFKAKLKLFENHEKYKELDPIIESNERLCEIIAEDIQEGRHDRYMSYEEDQADTGNSLKCETCGVTFPYEMALNKHILRTHRGQNVSVKFLDPDYQKREKKFHCENCSKSFYRAAHLAKHERTHVPSEKKFECTLCKKKFNRKDNLRSHMRVHEPNKDDLESNCLCVYCGRSFSNSSNLIVHMRRHTGEKPYKCDICEKGFPRSSDLQCHRRTHTGEKPCLCTICGKGFSRSNKLVRHMRIHTGQRPYKCTFCDRAFTQSNDLTLHIRRHTGDKPYVCNICGDRFIQGTALHTHRRLLNHHEPPQPPQPPVNSVNNPHRPMQKTKSSKHNSVTTEENTTDNPETKTDRSLNLSLTGESNTEAPTRITAGANGVTGFLTTANSLDVATMTNQTLFSISQYNQVFN